MIIIIIIIIVIIIIPRSGHSKLCATFKKLCLEQPSLAHLLLDKLTESLCIYASYQIQSGAQVCSSSLS